MTPGGALHSFKKVGYLQNLFCQNRIDIVELFIIPDNNKVDLSSSNNMVEKGIGILLFRKILVQ